MPAKPHGSRPPTVPPSLPRLSPGWLLVLAACSATHQARRADRSVERILPERTREVLGDREETAVRPLPGPAVDEGSGAVPGAEPGAAGEGPPPPPAEGASAGPPGASEGVGATRVLGLQDCLEIAIGNNRDYRTRLESLYLTVLGLVGTRHAYTPQLSALLGYFFADADGVPKTGASSLSLGATQILPTGATLSLGLSGGHVDPETGGGAFDTALSVQLAQPLLRGGGYDVTHEALVQAERDLVYAIRDFELFREDFSIDVARRYYGLVQTKRSIENQHEAVERFTFARRRAEAFFEVGRSNELNYLRARREELNSQDDLIQAEEGYQLELDRFRIFLGLPPEVSVDVRHESPAFVRVSYDTDSAVETALANRLDVLNQREQLEDSERGVRLAENALLPDLDLDLAYGLASDPTSSFGDQTLDRDSVSAAITFALPVDRVRERNALRATQIGLARNRRSLEEFLDNVAVEIKSAIRELERRQKSVEIQRELIRDQEKNLRIAELQFEQGRVDNRDVVDAQVALTNAKNGLIGEQVNYEIARLQLLRDLGILFIDDSGMWKE